MKWGLILGIFLLSFAHKNTGPINTLSAQSARPTISVSVQPNRSRRGETVRFKISISTSKRGVVTPPQLQKLNDWEVVNTFRSESPRVNYKNGRVSYTYKAEYTFFLRPLKTGKLEIPSTEIKVGMTPYRTEQLYVQVDSLPNGQASQPRRNHKQNKRPSVPSILGQHPQRGQIPTNPHIGKNIPQNESFFIRGELSKSDVWEGELIDLTYVLYQRQRNVTGFEMAKFPDFRGFLKEELNIFKNFSQNRVQIGNEILLRSEVIRYALFPIKTGELKIDPFEMRAKVHPRPDDIVNNLMTGGRIQTSIPMLKASDVLSVNVKPLPATPEGTQFTGAVGTFQVDMEAPVKGLSVDQPFTVQFTVGGKGNVKLIEAPDLPLPKSLELYEIKNTAELREDTTGYKSFEFLLLPRKNGRIAIPSFKWSYFNPDDGKYEVVETPQLQLNIEGTPTGVAKESGLPKKDSLSDFTVMTAPTEAVGTYSPRWLGFAWPILGAFYVLLAGAAVFKRRNDDLAEHLKNNPWKVTEQKIKDKEYKGREGLAILVDQWIREFFTGHLKDKSLHNESVRSDFERSIRSKLNPEYSNLLKELNKLYDDLDLVRFSANKESAKRIKTKEFFARAEKVSSSIISKCQFEEEAIYVDDDE